MIRILLDSSGTRQTVARSTIWSSGRASVCLKDRGGLGIIASHRMNVALMLRWVWQILREEGGLWLQLLQAKYLRGEPLLACSRMGGSEFWRRNPILA